MRIRRPFVVAALAVATTVSLALASFTSASASLPTVYYLALGDSLSVGYQPVPTPGDTDQGYTDQLLPKLQAVHPFEHIVLVKMGCSGETTGTMINGGKCTDGRYPLGSQLKQAEAFLRANGTAVKYVTIDIGANDVDGCARGPLGVDPVCIAQGTVTIEQNLPEIVQGLRAADGALPRSVGMSYYDPFLADWLTGTQGQTVALASLTALIGLNNAEQLSYTGGGFGFADVFGAFKSTTFSTNMFVAPYGKLPTAVAEICRWTYMCSLGNIHANPTGYGVIATAFKAKMP
jgi:lysophospholipase L1-like esterase